MAGNRAQRHGAGHDWTGGSPHLRALCERFECSPGELRLAIEAVGDDEERLEQHFDLVHGLTGFLRRPDILRLPPTGR
jgi:hypothetical protein